MVQLDGASAPVQFKLPSRQAHAAGCVVGSQVRLHLIAAGIDLMPPAN